MRKFLKSFVYAFHGIAYAIKHEVNFKIELFVALAVMILAVIFKCSLVEWMIILICAGLVLSVELLNTAIEIICDRQEKNIHPEIKIIKDVSAAAVLLCSISAAVCGIIIFLPKLLKSVY